MVIVTDLSYPTDHLCSEYNEHVLDRMEPIEHIDSDGVSSIVLEYVAFSHGIFKQEIKGTIFEHAIRICDNMYGVSSATFRLIPDGKSIGWHQDSTDSIHLPIYGNKGTVYKFKDKSYKMTDGVVHILKSYNNMHRVNSANRRLNIHMWTKGPLDK